MQLYNESYASSPGSTSYELEETIPNIILFGETGSGKSSIVNMLSGRDEAHISNGAKGCTFKNEAYPVTIDKKAFKIFDTAGFDESTQGTVPNHDAIVQLYKLLAGLQNGVSLLILCVRGPRLRGTVQYNWRLFKDIICQNEVPAVVVITGMEGEEGDMDDWWHRNKHAFQANDIYPNGFACITATKGKMKRGKVYQFQEEYDESREKVTKLILRTYRERAWAVKPVDWYQTIVQKSIETRMCWRAEEKESITEAIGPGVDFLMKKCMLSRDEAEELGKRLKRINEEIGENISYY